MAYQFRHISDYYFHMACKCRDRNLYYVRHRIAIPLMHLYSNLSWDPNTDFNDKRHLSGWEDYQ